MSKAASQPMPRVFQHPQSRQRRRLATSTSVHPQGIIDHLCPTIGTETIPIASFQILQHLQRASSVISGGGCDIYFSVPTRPKTEFAGIFDTQLELAIT